RCCRRGRSSATSGTPSARRKRSERPPGKFRGPHPCEGAGRRLSYTSSAGPPRLCPLERRSSMAAESLTPFEILLVEANDEDAARAMQALAPEGARWRVTRAEDGEEGLAMLRKTTPALMLLDLSMPKKTGMELLREIRGSDRPELKNLPVVILTTS